MKDRYKSRLIVDILITRDLKDKGKQVLLALRKNTGYRDGEYELPGGHVEAGEDLYDAMIREAEEELSINIKRQDLEIVHIFHHYKGDALKFIIKSNRYDGKIKIGEPDECAELSWFNINELPINMDDKIKRVITEIEKNIFYDNSDFINYEKSL